MDDVDYWSLRKGLLGNVSYDGLNSDKTDISLNSKSIQTLILECVKGAIAMEKCVFCNINNDRLEHLLIAQNGALKAVLDRYPITEGHILIISQSHESHLEHLNDHEYHAMFEFARELGRQLPSCMEGVEDYNLLVNNGKCSGQHIPHVHLHLIPRRRGDTFGFYWRLMTRFVNPFSSLGSDKNLHKVQRMWNTTG